MSKRLSKTELDAKLMLKVAIKREKVAKRLQPINTYKSAL